MAWPIHRRLPLAPPIPILALLALAALLFGAVAFAASSRPRTETRTSDFVTRAGSRLMLHGRSFRFSGTNIYWLGLDTQDGKTFYPSPFRVDDVLATAREMGATVVRADTLGMSQGCRLCVEPSLGHFNETALRHIDYAIKTARADGLRLIIELVDNWHYAFGGKHTFTDWRGLADETQFFYNPAVIADFEGYIDHLLNHVNTYTGVAYKDDPTIMAWETGDEITPPVDWTRTIARYLKDVDPHHLVLDGSRQVDPDGSWHINEHDLSLPTIDLYTDHYYPMSVSQLHRDASVVRAAHKVFVVGEYGWSSDPDRENTLERFLAAAQSDPNVAGDLYWSLFGHADTYGYVQHDDGYTLHYPGDTPDMRRRVELLRRHAYAMSGTPAPSDERPATPFITQVARPDDHNVLSWRGAAGAAMYSIEASTVGQNGPWKLICSRCATDTMTPWVDIVTPVASSEPVWYRVRPYNLSGVPGAVSPVFRAK